jgi:hypothetical protein
MTSPPIPGGRQRRSCMSAALLSWLPLAIKLLATAAIVVGASVIAERAGALTGALVATLPVTIWPAYVFLSLDHDAAYLAQAALSGLAINAVTGLFLLLYAVLAQTRGLIVSLAIAAACWISLAVVTRSVEWTLTGAALMNLVIYPVCLWLSRAVRRAKVPQLKHAWYDLPVRTILVCVLMAAILEASHRAGPVFTGILAVYPISSTSLMLILQPRLGGRASAAVSANCLWSLFGISFGLAALHLSIVPLGVPLALALALAVPLIWNLTVWIGHRRAALARSLPCMQTRAPADDRSS